MEHYPSNNYEIFKNFKFIEGIPDFMSYGQSSQKCSHIIFVLNKGTWEFYGYLEQNDSN